MDPILAPRVALMWQIVIGHALPCYSLARTGFGISLEKYAEYASGWVWGSQVRLFRTQIGIRLFGVDGWVSLG